MEALNIALPPGVVESKLRLYAAGTFRVIKHTTQVLMENVAGTKDFGPMNSSFNWRLYEPTPEWGINKMIGR